MLKTISYYYQKNNLDEFIKKHKNDKEKIFDEIYNFLGGREFK